MGGVPSMRGRAWRPSPGKWDEPRPAATPNRNIRTPTLGREKSEMAEQRPRELTHVTPSAGLEDVVAILRRHRQGDNQVNNVATSLHLM